MKSLLLKLSRFIRPRSLANEAMEEFNKILAGKDPDLLSPVLLDGALGYVPERYEKVVSSIGGTKDDQGIWRVPKDLDPDILQKIKALWVRVPKDLVSVQVNTLYTKDGDNINEHFLVEEQTTGGDTTSSALIWAMWPVSITLIGMTHILGGFFLNLFTSGFGHSIGMLIYGALMIAPVALLVLTALTTEELWGWKALAKGVFFGALWPIAAAKLDIGNLSVSGLLHSPIVLAVVFVPAVIIAGGLLMWGLFFVFGNIFGTAKKGNPFEDQNTSGSSSKKRWRSSHLDLVKDCVIVLVVLFLTHKAIDLLPSIFHPILVFAPACFLLVKHADDIWIWRGEMLMNQKMYSDNRSVGIVLDPQGPVQRDYRQQTILAAQDTSPLIEIGTAEGTLRSKYYTPFMADPGQTLRLSVNDMHKHVMVFGETGSGKTYSQARPVFYNWWRQKAGGALVLCGKGQLPEDLRPIIDIRIEPGFNWAMLQGLNGFQAGDIFRSFTTVGKANRDSQDNGSEAFWRNGALNFISGATQILWECHQHELRIRSKARQRVGKLLIADLMMTIEAMDNEVAQEKKDRVRKVQETDKASLEEERQYRWTYLHWWRMVQKLNDNDGHGGVGKEVVELMNFLGVDLNDEVCQKRRAARPERIHKDVDNPGSSLLENFDAVATWAGMPPQTRESFFANVSQIFTPLAKTGSTLFGENNVPWILIEQGQTLEDVFYGKTAGVFLKHDVYGDAARIASQIAKGYVYKKLGARGDRWKEEGQSRVLIMIDECHLLVGQAEVQLSSTIRSLGGCFFFLTQGFSSFGGSASFREIETKDLLKNFGSIICFKTDEDTYKWVSKKAGQMLTMSPISGRKSFDSFINVEQTLTDYNQSVFQRKDLEHYSWYQRMHRAGAGQILLQDQGDRGWHLDHYDALDVPYLSIGALEKVQQTNKDMSVISPDYLASVLGSGGRGHAFAYLTRAGSPRFEFIKCSGLSAEGVRKMVQEGPKLGSLNEQELLKLAKDVVEKKQ